MSSDDDKKAKRGKKDRRKPIWQNKITETGACLVALAFLLIASFVFFELISQPNPYLGLFTFLIFPAVAVIGIVLIVFGMLRARRRAIKLHGSTAGYDFYPRIDLNRRGHRIILKRIAIGVAISLPIVGFLSSEGYHYTESKSFCGEVCHPVMRPHGIAASHRSHAEIECAACHVGRGVNWYVKSKISGVRQLVALAMNSYERPIAPALNHLRPATDTCQNCHWSEKNFGNQLKPLIRHLSDEESTPYMFWMLIKTGGSDPATAPPSGIHWHMSIGQNIDYIATNSTLQDIPWVQFSSTETGRTTVYRSDGMPADAPPPPGIRRTVDCMDCHNRAAHSFGAPSESANTVLTNSPDLRQLPYAKKVLVEALVAPYETKDEAVEAIPQRISDYYRENHAQLSAERERDIERLAHHAVETYQRDFFPDMNVDWRSYANNIGHKMFSGCFRCHAGDHVAADGSKITHDCSACHEFVVPITSEEEQAVGLPAGGARRLRGERFPHPVELEGNHADLRCDSCHDGGPARESTCEGCHADVTAFRAGQSPQFEPVGIEADSMDGLADCTDCHDLHENLATVQNACFDCHEEDEPGMSIAAWKKEVGDLLGRLGDVPDEQQRAQLDALRRAGPYHNMEATRAILDRMIDARASAEVTAQSN